MLISCQPTVLTVKSVPVLLPMVAAGDGVFQPLRTFGGPCVALGKFAGARRLCAANVEAASLPIEGRAGGRLAIGRRPLKRLALPPKPPQPSGGLQVDNRS